jgi:hypothetical protein
LRAPAVGYRINCAHVAVFYVPDLASIRERAEALRGVALYIGDGATMTQSMVRHRDYDLTGRIRGARALRGLLPSTLQCLLHWHERKIQSLGHHAMGDHAVVDIEAVGQMGVFRKRVL